jgi:hypothetical protein
MIGPLNDDNLMSELLTLREKDPDAFMRLILKTLKTYPELAVQDQAPSERKLRALDRMLDYFIETEEYEECSFIAGLKKRIEDAQE